MTRFIFIAVLLATGIFSSLQAQTKASFGVKLNANLSDMKLTNYAGAKKSYNPGASIGGFSRIDFTESFALQPELILNYTESSVTVNGIKSKFKYAGVEIPVYAMGKKQIGNGQIFLGVGPHIGYGFSADEKTEKIPSGWPGDNKIELDHWYAGAGATVGYEFNIGLSVYTGYQRSYDLRSDKNAHKVKTNTFNIGVAYRF